ncbi:MAG TPA: glycosyl hydrolase family 28-related protein [Candidatus Hydrogenedentes bacterium]|nr:glycosyl hydrolase family 28-related protein [Candidatus Hydrogenedentota bacterium]
MIRDSRVMILFAGAAAALFLVACQSVSPSVAVEAAGEQSRWSQWNVLDFGAVGDGETDNTEAFQKALDAAAVGKGGVVFAPTGRYSFAGSLRVPKDVTLRGVFAWAPSHSGIRDKNDELPEFGTVLLPRGGAGSEEGPPFILLDTNSVLQGVCIYYPDQDLAPPTPYPWAIAMQGANPAVLDVELLNPYNGVKVGLGGRQLVRNVYGQPLHIGLFVDEAYDCCRLENVHWNPWWTYDTPMSRWQLDNGIGFLFGRSDGQYALNTFCFNYDIGYKFIRTEAGVTYGNFNGMNAELCHACVHVDACATWGVLINNSGYALLDPPRSIMVRVTGANRGSVRFNNCGFWGPTDRCAVIEGDAIGFVAFSNCTFGEWPENRQMTPEQRASRDPAITVLSGSIMVRGCEFRDHKPQFHLGPDVRGAVITGNLTHWPLVIHSEMTNEVVIADNLALVPLSPEES